MATMGAVKGSRLTCLVAITLFLGQNTGEGAEFEAAAAALASGGKVLKIQPWYFLGLPYTYVTDLPTSGAIVTVLTPLFFVTGLAVAALLVLRWNRFPARPAIMWASFLFPCVASCGAWAFGPVLTTPIADPLQFALLTNSDDLKAAFMGQAILWGSVWVWFRRTRFLARWREALADPANKSSPV